MTNTYTARGSAPDDCVRLERELAAFLDGTLDEARSTWAADHLAACDRCAALLDGLDEPSDVGRAVAALPALAAPDHLWQGVADRIAAPVVAIGPARREALVAGPAGRNRWFRTAAAAAVLVAATAGVTHELTLRSTTGGARTAVASTGTSTDASTAPAAGPGTPATTLPTTVASATPTGPASTEAQASAATSDPASANASRGASSVTNVANRSRQQGARRAAALPTDPARDTYDREIAKLRGVLAERRGALDTSTVRVLEQSMTVIDRAIAQSKAALARDPASGFLNQQLNNALDRKLELLRTAALLPAST